MRFTPFELLLIGAALLVLGGAIPAVMERRATYTIYSCPSTASSLQCCTGGGVQLGNTESVCSPCKAPASSLLYPLTLQKHFVKMILTLFADDNATNRQKCDQSQIYCCAIATGVSQASGMNAPQKCHTHVTTDWS